MADATRKRRPPWCSRRGPLHLFRNRKRSEAKLWFSANPQGSYAKLPLRSSPSRGAWKSRLGTVDQVANASAILFLGARPRRCLRLVIIIDAVRNNWHEVRTAKTPLALYHAARTSSLVRLSFYNVLELRDFTTALWLQVGKSLSGGRTSLFQAACLLEG